MKKIKNELIDHLNDVFNDYSNESTINLKNFEEIKNKLLNQESKMINEKDKYIRLNKEDKDMQNGKDNYNNEIDVVNKITEDSNKKYEKIYNNVNLLNNTTISKLKEIFLNYCEIIKEIGNIFFEFSENISQNLDSLDILNGNENIPKKIDSEIIEKNCSEEIDKKSKNKDNSDDNDEENNEFKEISDIDFNFDDYIDKDLVEDRNEKIKDTQNILEDIENDKIEINKLMKEEDKNKQNENEIFKEGIINEENNKNEIIESKENEESEKEEGKQILGNEVNQTKKNIDNKIKENEIKENEIKENEKIENQEINLKDSIKINENNINNNKDIKDEKNENKENEIKENINIKDNDINKIEEIKENDKINENKENQENNINKNENKINSQLKEDNNIGETEQLNIENNIEIINKNNDLINDNNKIKDEITTLINDIEINKLADNEIEENKAKNYDKELEQKNNNINENTIENNFINEKEKQIENNNFMVDKKILKENLNLVNSEKENLDEIKILKNEIKLIKENENEKEIGNKQIKDELGENKLKEKEEINKINFSCEIEENKEKDIIEDKEGKEVQNSQCNENSTDNLNEKENEKKDNKEIINKIEENENIESFKEIPNIIKSENGSNNNKEKLTEEGNINLVDKKEEKIILNKKEDIGEENEKNEIKMNNENKEKEDNSLIQNLDNLNILNNEEILNEKNINNVDKGEEEEKEEKKEKEKEKEGENIEISKDNNINEENTEINNEKNEKENIKMEEKAEEQNINNNEIYKEKDIKIDEEENKTENKDEKIRSLNNIEDNNILNDNIILNKEENKDQIEEKEKEKISEIKEDINKIEEKKENMEISLLNQKESNKIDKENDDKEDDDILEKKEEIIKEENNEEKIENKIENDIYQKLSNEDIKEQENTLNNFNEIIKEKKDVIKEEKINIKEINISKKENIEGNVILKINNLEKEDNSQINKNKEFEDIIEEKVEIKENKEEEKQKEEIKVKENEIKKNPQMNNKGIISTEKINEPKLEFKEEMTKKETNINQHEELNEIKDKGNESSEIQNGKIIEVNNDAPKNEVIQEEIKAKSINELKELPYKKEIKEDINNTEKFIENNKDNITPIDIEKKEDCIKEEKLNKIEIEIKNNDDIKEEQTNKDIVKDNEKKEDEEKKELNKEIKTEGEEEEKEYDFDIDDDNFEMEMNKIKLNLCKSNTEENIDIKDKEISLEKIINKENLNNIKKDNDLNNLSKITADLQLNKAISAPKISNIQNNKNNDIQKQNINNKNNNINNNANKNIIKKEENFVNKKQIKTSPKLSLPFFANQYDKEMYIDSAIKKLLSEFTLLEGEIKTLIDILYQNHSESKKYFSFTFLTNLKKYIKNKIIFLPNYENFNILSYIFTNISLKQGKIYIYKLVIEISELIKYKNRYLYKKIEKLNPSFKSNNFWKKMIEQIFIDSLNDFTNNLIIRENKKMKNSPKKENKNSFWKMFTSDSFINTVNELTNNMVIKEEYNDLMKEKNKNSIYLLELTGYSRYITQYKNLSHQLKKELDDFSKKKLDSIIYNNITHMSNYKVDPNMIKILILDFCAQFGFSNELKEYYINFIDSYNLKNHIYIRQKLDLNDRNNIALICILSNMFLFLPVNDRIKIISLNKKLDTQGLKKSIFQIILRKKNLSLKNRTLIWENILKIEKLQNKYNYTEIKKDISSRILNGELKKGTRLFKNNETIDKDVSRTIFLTENLENQQKLKNILRTLNLFNTSIGYYQGMSYITAFILQILNNDEEKTFYFMLSLETETKYKELFMDNLKLLNTNFKVLEKIFEIGLPEVYYHLLKNRIMANYYSPSWFLTIFSCVSPIFEINNIPQFSLMVFEKFILDGWEAVFNAGFTSIQYYYRELLRVHEDSIMNYLITNFCNKEIFKNKDFHIIENNYTINSGFINKELIVLLIKICSYEEQFKNGEEF